MKAGKKTGPFKWTAGAERAFHALKEKFEQVPLLKHFNPDKECQVETDASGRAVGAVISQPYEALGDSKRIT